LSLAINVGLTAIVADVVYRGPYLHPSHDLSFARVGFVSESSAKILIREPNPAALPVFLSYRSHDDEDVRHDAWKAAGAAYNVSAATDFTAVMTIDDLQPDTKYEFATSSNHSGSFFTAPETGWGPQRTRGTYTFLFSSCLKPRFPYSPLEHPLGVPGLRALAKWLPTLQPQLMLFLGDFIYIDVPRRFGTDVETYARQYRLNYASPDWPRAARALPWIHVLDDHDIANDWDRNTTGVYAAAAAVWTHYHAAANPPPVRARATYFAFTQGPAAFFMLDTRRFRSSELAPPDARDKTMLGHEQLADFVAWLRRPVPAGVKWKIVASSVPLTKNWRFNTKDTWGGYLVERQIILEAMWDAHRMTGVGVVVISGDRHEFAATSFPPPPGQSQWSAAATVHEFSTSPLNQFYVPRRTYKQSDTEDVLIK
jgi:alkaline phosphatase D